MPETFFDKWRGRFIGAWAILTGRAYAAYYMTEAELMRGLEDAGLVERQQ